MSDPNDSRIQIIESKLRSIEERNARVEVEKAWETSFTRRLAVLVLTYSVMLLVFLMLENSSPFKNACVPTLGFYLSTLSVPLLKKRWIGRYSEGR